MKLYNTLTRNIDEIVPLNAPLVTVYTCGPTVYDYAHIGHWFNYVRMDMLVRSLKLAGLKPEWVMNITDVGHLVSDADEGEDKLEKGARREGKTAWDVAEFYTRDFLEGMRVLNILTPDHIVKATEHIAEQIALIQKLESKGFTYIIDDGVYYDTSKFEGYAAFARLDLDEQQAGARVTFNTQKRNQSDFALWKFSPIVGANDKQRDMEWDSPWSPDDNPRKGFPGWHVECSAMSMKYLGDTLDIHTGGIDHIQVHHTNEIAQSEAATGKRFANAWMHSNHIMIDGEKVSKSLGNGIRIQEIIEKGITPEAVRLHILESHYRSQSKFSWESLEAAANRLDSYYAFADLLWELPETSSADDQPDSYLSDARRQITDLLTNDLDTPKVLAKLSELEGQWLRLLSSADRTSFKEFLVFIDAALGTNFASTQDITDEQYRLIGQLDTARLAKDWALSDKLREELASQKIGLRNTREHGTIWYHLRPQ
jgi:cysteinyl-tRNA synthetase